MLTGSSVALTGCGGDEPAEAVNCDIIPGEMRSRARQYCINIELMDVGYVSEETIQECIPMNLKAKQSRCRRQGYWDPPPE